MTDLTGQRFGHLFCLGYAGYIRKIRTVLWLCQCACGERMVILAHSLKQGRVKSCPRCAHVKHGYHGTPTYKTWTSMRERCADLENKDYGGRGIKVCDRWHDFANFLIDMGERPKGKTLDRIKVDGNYEPGNCRWATNKEQALNKRPRKPAAPIVPDAAQAETAEITGVHVIM